MTNQPAHEHIATLLRVPYRVLVRELYRRLAEEGFDLQPAHSSVFPNLRAGPAHSTELAEKAQITKQSMGYLLEALEKRGYVERIPDPNDGRAKLVRLTQAGVEAEQAATRIIGEIEAEWARLLGGRDAEQLRSLLQRLLDALRAETPTV